MIKDVILIMDVCWIGRNLHALREKNKLTQEKLGKDDFFKQPHSEAVFT